MRDQAVRDRVQGLVDLAKSDHKKKFAIIPPDGFNGWVIESTSFEVAIEIECSIQHR
jgi:hypothetical protein